MRFKGGMAVFLSSALAFAGLVTVSSPLLAAVKHEGSWPATDTKVSLDVSRVTRDEALRKLAEAAGWSVVVHAPQADLVDVHVKDQPASKVLDLLLSDADYVASRDGTLVSIRRVSADAAGDEARGARGPRRPGRHFWFGKRGDDRARGDDAHDDEHDDAHDDEHDDEHDGEHDEPQGPAVAGPPAPPIPPIPPVSVVVTTDPPGPPGPHAEPQEHGPDREVAGESLKIGKNEVVHDVSVMGGSLDVYGTVTGDISVMGGAVRVREGAHVFGDVSAVGGDIKVDGGGQIDGDVDVMGGSVRRGDKAIIHGHVHGGGRRHSSRGGHGDGDGDGPESLSADITPGSVGSALARMALLFVFGTMLLALAPERMSALKEELVARPMRSFAMGVLGFLGAAATLLILCVTIIGVPFAMIGAVLALFALGASMCAVLETLGRALTRHKSQNPYVHLAVGCFLFLALSAIPYVGPLAVITVLCLSAGTLVSTRGAGLVQRKNGPSPYRSVPA